MRIGVPSAGRLSLVSELTYGNMAVCILQTFHLLTNAACFLRHCVHAFAHMCVRQSELHIDAFPERVVGASVFVCACMRVSALGAAYV